MMMEKQKLQLEDDGFKDDDYGKVEKQRLDLEDNDRKVKRWKLDMGNGNFENDDGKVKTKLGC